MEGILGLRWKGFSGLYAAIGTAATGASLIGAGLKRKSWWGKAVGITLGAFLAYRALRKVASS